MCGCKKNNKNNVSGSSTVKSASKLTREQYLALLKAKLKANSTSTNN